MALVSFKLIIYRISSSGFYKQVWILYLDFEFSIKCIPYWASRENKGILIEVWWYMAWTAGHIELLGLLTWTDWDAGLDRKEKSFFNRVGTLYMLEERGDFGCEFFVSCDDNLTLIIFFSFSVAWLWIWCLCSWKLFFFFFSNYHVIWLFAVRAIVLYAFLILGIIMLYAFPVISFVFSPPLK